MKFITWDSGVLAAFGLLLAYSLLIRKHKALATLVSVYVGYVMASAWGEQVTAFFAGDRVFLNQIWIKANASPFVVQTGLMIVVALLLSSFIKLGGKRSKYSMLEVGVYAFCTLALVVMFMISFMTPAMRDQVFAVSHILPLVYQWRKWILAVPVFVIIFFGMYNED